MNRFTPILCLLLLLTGWPCHAKSRLNILWIFIAAAILGAASGLFAWFVNFDFGF